MTKLNGSAPNEVPPPAAEPVLPTAMPFDVYVEKLEAFYQKLASVQESHLSTIGRYKALLAEALGTPRAAAHHSDTDADLADNVLDPVIKRIEGVIQ